MSKSVRRVITGHDDNGKARGLIDGVVSNTWVGRQGAVGRTHLVGPAMAAAAAGAGHFADPRALAGGAN